MFEECTGLVWCTISLQGENYQAQSLHFNLNNKFEGTFSIFLVLFHFMTLKSNLVNILTKFPFRYGMNPEFVCGCMQ